MRSFKIAQRDIKELFTNRFKRVAVIVVALMPLLYSFLYLYAFWDPYSKLDKMPVAVVNLDKGSIKDGEKVNYGGDIVDELKDNRKIKWEFVDYNKAMDGLNNEGYYSVVIIPEDFSKKITDVSDGKIDKAHLIYIPNEKKNFLAAQVSSRIMLELKDEVAKSITEEASKVVIDSLYDVKDGLKEAKDGSLELYDGAVKLRDGSDELKNGLKKANDGVLKLNDGSGQLKNGLGSLKEGTVKLDNGALTLSNGIYTASDGSKKLKSGLDELSQGQTKFLSGMDSLTNGLSNFAPNAAMKKLYDGSAQLEGGLTEIYNNVAAFKSKLEEGAPQVFNLAEGANKLADGTSKLSDGAGNLAVGVGSLASGASQLQSGINQLAGGISQLNTQLTSAKLDEGLKNAANGIDGVADAISSAKALIEAGNYEGAKAVLAALESKDIKNTIAAPLRGASNKVTELNQATSQLAQGANILSQKTGELAQGAGKVAQGAAQLKEATTQLSQGAKQVSDGTVKVADSSKGSIDGLTKLLEGLDKARNGAVALKEGLNKADAGLNQVVDGANALKQGAGKINDGLILASSKMGELSDGLDKLYAGSKELKNGTSSLNDGAIKLYDGSVKLNDGLVSLKEGTSKLYDGSIKLNDGLYKLTDGTDKLKDGLNEGYDKINSKLKFTSSDMSKFMSEPVKLDEKPINHVPDYGTGFAPYFIPLSLWVGALIMFFIVSDDVDEEFKGHSASIVFGKFMTFAFLGILQAVASSFILRSVLHLTVKNVVLFYGFNILLSFVFIAVIQSLIFIFKDAGRFLALVLLMLQLTSCAGTFPLELVPKFFVSINPYLPMTYATSALREIISGIDYSVLNKDILVLLAFMVAFMMISIILKSRMDKIAKRIERLKEARQTSIA